VSSDPVLEIKGLTVRLPEGADREFAIQDVSLSVGKGEIVLDLADGDARTVGLTRLHLEQDAGKSLVRLQGLATELWEADRPNEHDALVHAQGAARAKVSKFEPCLPEGLLLRLMSESVLDVKGARAPVRPCAREHVHPGSPGVASASCRCSMAPARNRRYSAARRP